MAYSVVDTTDVEAINGVFRPIRRALGVTAFGINQEEWPAHADQYPDHDHAEDGQEEVYVILEGGGTMIVDGDEVELRPGRYVLVGPESKRKILPGENGLKVIIVGAPPGAYEPRQG
jgi:mannose-6-phosphate isomerase-like protein (cupin superfamily)